MDVGHEIIGECFCAYFMFFVSWNLHVRNEKLFTNLLWIVLFSGHVWSFCWGTYWCLSFFLFFFLLLLIFLYYNLKFGRELVFYFCIVAFENFFDINFMR